MIAVKTCGKLYWAGEYAILEPGQLALIKAIPIYMKAEIAFSENYRIYSDMFDFAVDLTPNPDYSLIQETIALVGDFLAVRGQTLRPFSLEIRGKMEREGKKFGLGSSGSVVVLVIKALLALYDITVDPELLFKLASAVLLKRGDNGSMGDLACIVSEDLILYQSFDRQKVATWLEEESLATVLERDWGFSISQVQPGLECDIESNGSANQAKHRPEFFKFLKSNGFCFGRSLGAGACRKNYRAGGNSQSAFRRFEPRYLHTFAQTAKTSQPRFAGCCQE